MNTTTQWPHWRTQLKSFIENALVQRFIITLIIINAAILGLETNKTVMANWGQLLQGIDAVILGVFVVEITLRMIVHRFNFFRDPWSIFDFSVVAIALVPASVLPPL